ncbi:MAG: L-serine ammonia-lyase, partial [Proteobacteria bacterium]|nr:L-serine ammonia-lyase [Pseudomonadota bacterium]
ADAIRVRLFGSLSATGQGHGTHRAVLAGLLGYGPDTCPANLLDELQLAPAARHRVDLGAASIKMGEADITQDAIVHDYPFSNTMLFSLHSDGEVLFEREYYSVGGGFLQWKGWEPPVCGAPEFPYGTMTELKTILEREGLRLHEVILRNEMSITGASEQEVLDGLDRVMGVMLDSVERGIRTEGVLPGSIGLSRKAPNFFARARDRNHRDRFLLGLNAYAVAASEENAAGHCIVTAPTCGAAGVMPAVVRVMQNAFELPQQSLREGLMAAAAVGFLAKHNASISGAEVGCQGEVGVASAMAAAMLAYGFGHRFKVTENAAETALEHHLGLTCDPVAGLVQIPCIERNAMGAVKAYNAFLIADAEIPGQHVVDLDRAIQAMAETGRDMDARYKETSRGGLAVSQVDC